MIELLRSGRTPEELAKEFEPTAQTIRSTRWSPLPPGRHPPLRARDPGRRSVQGLQVERLELARSKFPCAEDQRGKGPPAALTSSCKFGSEFRICTDAAIV